MKSRPTLVAQSGRFPRALVVLRRLLDVFPFTWLGLLVSSAAAFGLKYFAFGRLDLIALVIGYVGLGLPLVALLCVVVALAIVGYRLRRARSVFAERVDTTITYDTHVTLPSIWFLPFVDVRVEWLAPQADVSLRRTFNNVHERVTFPERGTPSLIVRRVIVGDVFGLVRVALWRQEPITLQVLPHPGMLKNVPALLSMAGGDDIAHPLGLEDGDRIELRRYAPGDPARFIHWKVYGRTRKLIVRKQERALSRAKRTVAYLIAGPDDEASAAVARVALEGGALGGQWSFGADGTAGVIRNREEALSAIAKSVNAREDGGAQLGSFLREIEAEGPASIVLFVPPTAGSWLKHVQAVIAQRRDTRLVIGVDTLLPKKVQNRFERWLRIEAPTSGTRKERLDEVMAALGARSAPLLIERHTGRVLGDAHRRALDAIERKVA